MHQWILAQYVTDPFHMILFVVLMLIGFSYRFKKIMPKIINLKSTLIVAFHSYVVFPLLLLVINKFVKFSPMTVTAMLLTCTFSGGRFAFISSGIFRLATNHAFWQVLGMRMLSVTLTPSIFLFYIQFINPDFTLTLLNVNTIGFVIIDSLLLLVIPFILGVTLNYFLTNSTKKELLKALKYGGLTTLSIFFGTWAYKVGTLIIQSWHTEFWGVIGCSVMMLMVTYWISHTIFKCTKTTAYTSSMTAINCNFLLISMIVTPLAGSDKILVVVSLWSWTAFIMSLLIHLYTTLAPRVIKHVTLILNQEKTTHPIDNTDNNPHKMSSLV